MTGYKIGPTIPATELPWPYLWEQDPKIDDGHAHDWECCLLAADGLHRVRIEEIVRCAVCLAPRCGHSGDDNPCMERRHHQGLHFYLDGAYEPVGSAINLIRRNT